MLPAWIKKATCINRTCNVKSSPITGLDRPRRFQEVKVPRFHDNKLAMYWYKISHMCALNKLPWRWGWHVPTQCKLPIYHSTWHDILLLLLPLALQPTVDFGLSKNVLQFFPICHQLSPSSHSQHLKISFYFLFPSFPGSSVIRCEWRIECGKERERENILVSSFSTNHCRLYSSSSLKLAYRLS